MQQQEQIIIKTPQGPELVTVTRRMVGPDLSIKPIEGIGADGEMYSITPENFMSVFQSKAKVS